MSTIINPTITPLIVFKAPSKYFSHYTLYSSSIIFSSYTGLLQHSILIIYFPLHFSIVFSSGDLDDCLMYFFTDFPFICLQHCLSLIHDPLFAFVWFCPSIDFSFIISSTLSLQPFVCNC